MSPPRPRRLAVEPLEPRALLATLPTGFAEAPIATGLSNSTAMEIAPNGDLWVLEQAGAVKRFHAGSTTADVVGRLAGLGMSTSGERGLLGIAFDPQYATTKQVFLYYTSTSGGTHNRISRFTVDDTDAADYFFAGTSDTATDKGSTGNPTATTIFDLDLLSGATNHNGGAIHFGPDGKLYAAVGDNANGANAQSLSNVHGKILRMNPDGSAPPDNPFVSSTSGKQQTIWALGLRNPFTFAFQPGTSRMFINDVGQNAWEEVNDGLAGSNYGWPNVEGDTGNPPSSPGTYRAPIHTYAHSTCSFGRCAITGGAFYNATTQQFPAEYNGDYFFADYVDSFINVRDSATGAVTRFASGADNPVDLRVAADGSLHYLSRGGDQVIRVTSIAARPPTITKVFDQQVAENGLRSVPFTVDDTQTAPGDLIVTVEADNAALLPPGSLQVQGTGGNRTLQITPASDQTGNTLVYLTVSDGALSARTTFFLLVSSETFAWHNPTSAFDVNANGVVSAGDALDVINLLNSIGAGLLAPPAPGNTPPPYVDVAPDHLLAPIDVLYVINIINAGLAEAEGESSPAPTDAALLDLLAFDLIEPTSSRRRSRGG